MSVAPTTHVRPIYAVVHSFRLPKGKRKRVDEMYRAITSVPCILGREPPTADAKTAEGDKPRVGIAPPTSADVSRHCLELIWDSTSHEYRVRLLWKKKHLVVDGAWQLDGALLAAGRATGRLHTSSFFCTRCYRYCTIGAGASKHNASPASVGCRLKQSCRALVSSGDEG